jgi:hypothetical protein
MRRVSPLKAVAVIALASAAVVAACSSTSGDSCGSGTPPSLAGNWDLRAFTLGTTTVPAPPATGELRIHEANATTGTYAINYDLTGGSSPQFDSGNYVLTGQHCMSQSSLVNAAQPQFVGTYTLTTVAGIDSLAVTGSAGGLTVDNYWKHK